MSVPGTIFECVIVFVYKQLNVKKVQLNIKTVLFPTIQFSISTLSMSKTVLFQTIQFSIQKHFHFKQFSFEVWFLCLMVYQPLWVI